MQSQGVFSPLGKLPLSGRAPGAKVFINERFMVDTGREVWRIIALYSDSRFTKKPFKINDLRFA
jgi:hypothetical protein